MTLREIIKNIDTNKKEHYVSLEAIASEFDILDFLDGNSSRIQSYFYAKWQCTDTWVGGRIYFLDDEPICISWQQFRKSDEDFKWLSMEAYNKAHKYICSLMRKELKEPELTSLDIEMGDGYEIKYSGEFLITDVVYKPTKQNVTIVDFFNDKITSQEVKIKFADGTTQVVATLGILVPYNKN